MGRRWYATRFHPSQEDNDGDLPDVGDTEFWERGRWHSYSISAFQKRERDAGLLGLTPEEKHAALHPTPDPGLSEEAGTEALVLNATGLSGITDWREGDEKAENIESMVRRIVYLATDLEADDPLELVLRPVCLPEPEEEA